MRIRYFDAAVGGVLIKVEDEIRRLVKSPSPVDRAAGVRFFTLLVTMDRDKRPYGTPVPHPLAPPGTLRYDQHGGHGLYHSSIDSPGTGRATELRILLAATPHTSDPVAASALRHGLM